MTNFDDRENAFENLFVHDRELQFKAEAHRNRAVGRWAAGLMGKSAAEADAYGETIVDVGIAGAGAEAVLSRLKADLDAAGASVTDAALRERMVQDLAVALERLKRD